jgi:L-lactate dehydrogenase complex protein LldG
MSNAREVILDRISKALDQPSAPQPQPDYSKPIYSRPDLDAVTEFADNFASRKGILIPCANHDQLRIAIGQFLQERQFKHVKVWEPDLAVILTAGNIPFDHTDNDLAAVEAGITFCECIIGRTGSFITTSKQLCGRRLTIYPPTHIVVAYTSQLVDDIGDGLAVVTERYGDKLPSMIGLVTGASRTADIEKTLVLGAHGPKELVMFLVDDSGLTSADHHVA